MSLIALAHANHALSELTASGIAFYATCATVIPVLFLAFAVQGNAWQDFLRAAETAHRRSRERRSAALLAFGGAPSVGIASLILYANVVCEGVAIMSLYRHADDPFLRSVVGAAVVAGTNLQMAQTRGQWLRFVGVPCHRT